MTNSASAAMFHWLNPGAFFNGRQASSQVNQLFGGQAIPSNSLGTVGFIVDTLSTFRINDAAPRPQLKSNLCDAPRPLRPLR